MVAINVNEGATGTIPLENAVVFPVRTLEDRKAADRLMLERVCAGVNLEDHVLLYNFPFLFPEAANRYHPYICSDARIGRELLD